MPRFLSTRLDWNDYEVLVEDVKNANLISICTPFDEFSVSKVEEFGFDILKIASCSAKDWPLLEAAAETGLPIIASTGGLLQSEVDALVSFLEHRGCDFSLMHCVSIYPTPSENCNLLNISNFKQRYPRQSIGWPTHEAPEDLVPVQIARSLGAEMFERHVGIETQEFKLNAYSSTPKQIEAWFKAKLNADVLLGDSTRSSILAEERDALDGLKRGVYLKRPIKANETIKIDDVYFAFPCAEEGLSSGEWSENIISKMDLKPNDALLKKQSVTQTKTMHDTLKKAVHDVRARLNIANIPLNAEFTVEFSHHYGIENFNSIGTVMVNVINREYCKKILVQLPKQQHPLHYHKLKEETFLVLSGELCCELDGKEYLLKPGDTLLVLPGVWHRFWTDDGAIFEEISTTHFANDSVYRDARINKMSSIQRKTVVDHWGRFQIQEQLKSMKLPDNLIAL